MKVNYLFKGIKLLILDFDGVLTDNRVLVDENGKESVFCDRADGLGIERLKKKNIDIIVLSKEKNNVVKARCEKMKVECIHAVDNKYEIFLAQIQHRGVDIKDVCFVGNDVNDLECVENAGLGVAVNDAYPEVIKVADYITKKRGGEGAVREVVDNILGEMDS